jgi:hypothetical protein
MGDARCVWLPFLFSSSWFVQKKASPDCDAFSQTLYIQEQNKQKVLNPTVVEAGL